MGREYRNRKEKGNSTDSRCCRLRKAQRPRTVSLIVQGCCFEIKSEVIERLTTYAQHEGNELCGVLTGSQIGENVYRISKVSPPCVAKNSRCGCERDATKANAFIKKDYGDSERTRAYIGEWHTHPEYHPTPSGTDYRSIIHNYQTSELAFPFLVMIIVGTKSIYSCVYDGQLFNETPFIIR